MASPLDVFNWTHSIQHIADAAGRIEDGTYTPPASTATSITGHVMLLDRNAASEWSQRIEGVVEVGQTVLGTTAALAVDDRVRIHDDDSGTNYRDFRVQGILHKHSGPVARFVPAAAGRVAYLLMEENDGA